MAKKTKKIGAKSISFNEDEKELFDFLDQQDNISKFMKRLLRKEYEAQKERPVLPMPNGLIYKACPPRE